MKIVFVISRLCGGGAERAVSRLANALARTSNDVAIVVYKRCENEYFLSERVSLFCLDLRCTNKIMGKLLKIYKMRKYLCAYGADVVIPFSPKQAEDTYWATLGIKTRMINTVRNNPENYPSTLKEKKSRDWYVKHAAACVSQTEEQRKYFSGCSPLIHVVIPNSINDAYFARQHEYRKISTIVTVGRLEKQKNHEMLIRAFIQAGCEGVVLKIYGEGEEKLTLHRLIHELHAEQKIILCGHTNNVSDVLEKADLFILSSDYEGMPNALIEAMACGVPCISTDCPTGPKELIADHKSGLLVPVNDQNQMADAICYMVKNSERARLMGETGQQVIQNKCSESIIVNEWEKLIEKVIN